MHKYPRNPCYQRRGLAGGTISPPLAQLFQPALATTRVRYGVMDDALARQPSLRPTLPPSSFFPSLPSFPRRHPLAWLPPCHGRCRLNNYPHGVLNSSLATWNPSTEFARPLCGTLRLDRAGALRGELLINTSAERGREGERRALVRLCKFCCCYNTKRYHPKKVQQSKDEEFSSLRYSIVS